MAEPYSEEEVAFWRVKEPRWAATVGSLRGQLAVRDALVEELRKERDESWMHRNAWQDTSLVLKKQVAELQAALQETCKQFAWIEREAAGDNEPGRIIKAAQRGQEFVSALSGEPF